MHNLSLPTEVSFAVCPPLPLPSTRQLHENKCRGQADSYFPSTEQRPDPEQVLKVHLKTERL